MAGRRRNATTKKLTPFEGHDVESIGVKIVGGGTGLSEALNVEPVEHEVGSKVWYVVEADVAGAEYVPVKDSSSYRRVEKYATVDMTFVDQGAVADVLEAHRVKVEEAKGIHRLPLPEGDQPGDE